MSVERFKEILIQIPCESNDLSAITIFNCDAPNTTCLSVVNRKENQPLFEELFEIYRNASASERSLMTKFVKSRVDLSYKLVHWIPPFKETDPKRYLELRLTSVVIRDGVPDFRDDLLRLVYLWDFAEENGINAEKLFKGINEMADSHLFHQVMDPNRRKGLRPKYR